jgi:hypothetical protein
MHGRWNPWSGSRSVHLESCVFTVDIDLIQPGWSETLPGLFLFPVKMKIIYNIRRSWNNHSMKPSFLLLISALCLAPHALACEGLTGVWEQQLEETEAAENPAIFTIAEDCRIIMIQAEYRSGDTPLTFESIFRESGQLRIQYRIIPGAMDPEGNPYPSPLPEELHTALRGNVYPMNDGSLRFSLDILDALCGTGEDRCVSSPFVRRF